MEITVKVNYKNEKLQKLRQAAGLSQSQLAEAAGVNVRMYQKYEQGDRDISKAQLTTPVSYTHLTLPDLQSTEL